MERKRAADFPQELLDLFQLYVRGEIDHRAFLDGAKKFATGGVTAAMLWETLRPNYAWAEQVLKDGFRLKIERSVAVSSPQGNGSIKGYLVRPANAGGKICGIIVIHENRGLNPYIEDVARRLSLLGYMAFAPDGLTSVGSYPGDEEAAAKALGNVDRGKMLEDFVASARWLKTRSDCNGKLGAVGFCFGGGIVNALAVKLGSDLTAGVAFYGQQPSAEDTAKVKAPLMLHYASLDTRLTGGWPAFEQALKNNHATYQGFIYEGANHGFHNDTTPRYDEAAAKLAWQRSVGFFNQYLKG